MSAVVVVLAVVGYCAVSLLVAAASCWAIGRLKRRRPPVEAPLARPFVPQSRVSDEQWADVVRRLDVRL